MSLTLLGLFDLIGTIAFAISGAAVGIRKKMDIFGVNMLAVSTACGGGLIRDMIIGVRPPNMFKNPFYFGIAVAVANLEFLISLWFYRKYKQLPADGTAPIVGHPRAKALYDETLFWFDTLGLAAFAVDGVTVGIHAGYANHRFLLVFLGFLTGVGGGALRDIMADQMPDIFRKHIYALAAIAGAIVMIVVRYFSRDMRAAMIMGFLTVIVLRFLARHFQWNLPKIDG